MKVVVFCMSCILSVFVCCFFQHPPCLPPSLPPVMEGRAQQQLLNFCLEPFVECMTSESVTADCYSSANLVAIDGGARNRGFRVEHFVRPPVTLMVDFSVAVAVCCVLLCPDLPTQAELRLELNGSHRKGSDCFRLCHGVTARGNGGNMVVVMKNPLSWKKRGVDPANISSAAVRKSYVAAGLEKAELQEFWMKACPMLGCCRHLQVKISWWTGTKPVSLKWMEVWGVPAKNCTQEEARLFQTKWSACGDDSVEPSSSLSLATTIPIPQYFHSPDPHLNPIHHFHPDLHSNHPNTTNQSSSASSSHDGERSPGDGADVGVFAGGKHPLWDYSGNTPTKLLDEITFEVMVLPMLLPSGHCVDQSTLDKLARADTACGRPPTDPFTGNLTSDNNII